MTVIFNSSVKKESVKFYSTGGPGKGVCRIINQIAKVI